MNLSARLYQIAFKTARKYVINDQDPLHCNDQNNPEAMQGLGGGGHKAAKVRVSRRRFRLPWSSRRE